METIKIFEIKRLILNAQSALAVALHAIETKIIIGEIHHPEAPKPKRVYRKKVKAEIKTFSGGVLGGPEKTLPEDKSPFFTKPKRGRRKKALYEPSDEGEAL